MTDGELSLDVVANLRGFARRLRKQVEEATRDVEATVQVVPDDRNLRARLRKVVKAASVDQEFDVGVNVDDKGLRQKLRKTTAAASKGQKATVGTDLDAKDLPAKARVAKTAAQKTIGPLKIKLDVDTGKAQLLSSVVGLLKIPVIIAAVGPLIGLVSSLSAGLVALVSALAPVVNLAGLAPAALFTLAQGFGAVKLATAGVGEAFGQVANAQSKLASGQKLTQAELDNLKASLVGLSPAGRTAVQAFARLLPKIDTLKRSAQQAFFAPFAKQISAVANGLLPTLQSALTQTAGIIGNTVSGIGRLLAAPAFRTQLAQTMASNNRAITSLSTAVGPLVKAFFDLLRAAGPVIETIAKSTAAVLRNVSAWVSARAASGKLTKDFERGRVVAAQFLRVMHNLASGLLGVGKAAAPLGGDLLNRIEALSKRFAEFANSTRGQNSLKKWFDDAKPGILATAALIGAISTALVNAGTSESLAPLLDQIRTEFLPALGRLTDSVSSGFGPALITAASKILDLFATLTGSGGGALTVFVTTLGQIAEVVNRLLTTVPGATTALGTFIAVGASAKALSGIGSIIGGAGMSIFNLGKNAVGAVTGTFQFTKNLLGIGAAAGPAASGAAKAGAAIRGGLGAAIQATGKGLSALTKGIIATPGAVTSGLTTAVSAVGKGTVSLISGLGRGLAAAPGAINRLAEASAGAGTRGLKALGRGAVDLTKSVGRDLGRALTDSATRIRGLASAAVSGGGKLAGSLGKAASTAGQAVSSGFGKLVSRAAANSAEPLSRLTPVLGKIGRAASSAAASVGRFAATVAGNAAKSAVGLATSVGKTAVAFGRLVAQGAAATLTVVKNTVATVAAAIAQRAVAIATTLWAGAFRLLNLVFVSSPIGWIVLGIGLLVAAVVLVATKTRFFQTVWSAVWGAVKAIALGVFNWIKEHWPLILVILTGPVGIAVLLIVRHWNTIKNAFVGVFNWIKQHWPLILAILTGPVGVAVLLIVKNWNSIKTFLSNIWNGIKLAAQVVWNGITGVIRAAVNSVVALVNGIRAGVETAWKNTWNALKNTATTIWNGIKKVFGTPVEFVVNTVVGGVVRAVNKVLGWIHLPQLPEPHVAFKYARGGRVPGYGGGDVWPALLEPGEAIVPKHLVPEMAPWAAARGIPGFRDGGLFGAIGRGAAGAAKTVGAGAAAVGRGAVAAGRGLTNAADWVVDQGAHLLRAGAAKALEETIKPLVDQLAGMTDRFGPVGQMMGGLGRSAVDKMIAFVRGHEAKESQFVAQVGPPGVGVSRWSTIALQALQQAGQPGTWLPLLLERMRRESGGNPAAINLTDVNAQRGDPSKGLMQVIGSTFRAYAGPLLSRGVYDPLANIYASIKYTLARYGTLQAWSRPGGYATGAWEILRDQIAMIHRGEMVIPAAVADQIRQSPAAATAALLGPAGAAARAGIGPGTTSPGRIYNFTINAAPDTPTSQQILRLLSYAEALHA